MEPFSAAFHWVTFRNAKGEKKRAPIICPSLDPKTGEYKKDSGKCCKIIFSAPETARKKAVNTQKPMYSPAIVRKLQKKSNKYVRWIKLPPSAVASILEQAELAIEAIEEQFSKKEAAEFSKNVNPAHEKYGFDFNIKYNVDAATPAGKYPVSFVGVTPLTSKEKKAVAVFEKKMPDPNKVVEFSTEENMLSLLGKSALAKYMDGSNGSKAIDLSKMDKEELLEYIEDEGVEVEMPLKKLKKKKAAVIRKQITEALKIDDEEDEEDEEKEESLDREALEKLAKKHGVKGFKKMSDKKLKKAVLDAIQSAKDEDEDDEDDEDEDEDDEDEDENEDDDEDYF